MGYEVVERININKKRCKKIGAFLYDPGVDGLYLDANWWFPVQIGFEYGLTRALITPMFYKIPFIMKGWINQDILLRLVELLNFVNGDKILMHASCVDNTLIVGLPNSGKTYQTYKSVSAGGQLISEEYTIIWGRLAIPYKEVMRTCFSKRTMDDCGIKTDFREKAWLAAATLRSTLAPFMYEPVIWKEIPSSGSVSTIKKIVYGSTGREITDWKEFAILCENEFPFMANEFLQAYSIASGFDLIGLQEKQRNLIKEFVNAIYPSSVKV